MLLPYTEALNRTCNVYITESQFPIRMTGNATKGMSRRGRRKSTEPQRCTFLYETMYASIQTTKEEPAIVF